MKDQFIGMNKKQKVRIKIQQINKDIFLNQILLESIDFVYTNQDANAKKFNARKYYLQKVIIKNYNVIINGKSFYDKFIDFNVKQYKEVK